jgi:hypothetical protein
MAATPDTGTTAGVSTLQCSGHQPLQPANGNFNRPTLHVYGRSALSCHWYKFYSVQRSKDSEETLLVRHTQVHTCWRSSNFNAVASDGVEMTHRRWTLRFTGQWRHRCHVISHWVHGNMTSVTDLDTSFVACTFSAYSLYAVHQSTVFTRPMWWISWNCLSW